MTDDVSDLFRPAETVRRMFDQALFADLFHSGVFTPRLRRKIAGQSRSVVESVYALY